MYQLYIKPQRYYKKSGYYKNTYKKELKIKTKKEIDKFIYKSTKMYLNNTFYYQSYFMNFFYIIKKMTYLYINNSLRINIKNYNSLNKFQYYRILNFIKNIDSNIFLNWMIYQKKFQEMFFLNLFSNINKKNKGDDYEMV